ncbi:MAG: MBL fold metallo-hydrolase [Candidatus Daviesbacteria bacterium]|nr:MBL fold metallo-hydrolase [Candidatus Daviesbacteria bacterium]
MDIYWYGQSCFKIKGKSATVFIDPFDPDKFGLKLPKDVDSDLVLSTHDHPDHNNFSAISGEPLRVSGPGEYEKSGVSVLGVGTYHDETKGAERGRNTVFNLMIDGINVVHLGDLGHMLDEVQVSEIGNVDILLLPVGGVYTIDGEVAAKVVAQLEPKIVVPMHYNRFAKTPGFDTGDEGEERFQDSAALSGEALESPKYKKTADSQSTEAYKLPELKAEIEGVEKFLKAMGAESIPAVPKLSITKDKLPEETQVVVLSKS